MNHPRPRILYLAPAWPYEKSFGKQVRVLHVARALQDVGEVSLAIASDTDDAEAIEKTAGEFQVHGHVGTKVVPNGGLRNHLRRWLNRRYLNLFTSVADERDRIRICESLNQFDLIWINSLRVANMFGLWRWPRSVLDVDDIPSSYSLAMWRNGDRPMDRVRAGLRTISLRWHERLLPERFTVLAVCSDADRRYLGAGSLVHVIPNGFERPNAEPQRRPSQPPRLGFIGLFSYAPNLDGMRWFLRECWPRIKREIPDARLRLVGKDSDGPLKPTAADVDSLGWMADPSDEIATWAAMIVPVRLGAGTRVKVAEAFSRKCPLVSTRLGAFGYDVVHGRELLLADSPEAFSAACIQAVRDPSSGTAMAERAWTSFLEKWTWDAIKPRVWAAAEHSLRLSGSTPSELAGIVQLRKDIHEQGPVGLEKDYSSAGR